MKPNFVRPRLALAFIAVAPVTSVFPASPAAAIPVFDPTNYAQNVLQAARALEQINNQVRSLQNETAMLQNMAKNLQRFDFPQLGQMNGALQKITQLMGQAQGIGFQASSLDRQFTSLFPGAKAGAAGANAQAVAARSRLDTAMAAFQQTMSVQAQVAENVKQDAATLAELAATSQASEGGLQAQQATNQLLALAAKQQLQLQGLLAAQFRSEALDGARRVQAEGDAREATRRFLGSGKAYTPQ